METALYSVLSLFLLVGGYMSFKDYLLEQKKNTLYNNIRQSDYARHFLDEYRICIDLYSKLEEDN